MTLAKYNVFLSLLALPGYAIAIFLIDRLGRKRLQWTGFLLLGVTYMILGGLFSSLTQIPTLLFFLYSFTFLFSNAGPNTTTYVIPGEYFPTEVRTTCHGLASAAGKIGAAIAAYTFPIIQQNAGVDKLMLICGAVSLTGMAWTLAVLSDYDPVHHEEEVQRKRHCYHAEVARLHLIHGGQLTLSSIPGAGAGAADDAKIGLPSDEAGSLPAVELVDLSLTRDVRQPSPASFPESAADHHHVTTVGLDSSSGTRRLAASAVFAATSPVPSPLSTSTSLHSISQSSSSSQTPIQPVDTEAVPSDRALAVAFLSGRHASTTADLCSPPSPFDHRYPPLVPLPRPWGLASRETLTRDIEAVGNSAGRPSGLASAMQQVHAREAKRGGAGDQDPVTLDICASELGFNSSEA